MKLRLHFELPLIGDVEIHTDSGHGSYDKLIINRQDLTEDGDACEMVREAITQEQYLWALYCAQYEGQGIFRQKASA
jgi:hypothetical protein